MHTSASRLVLVGPLLEEALKFKPSGFALACDPRVSLAYGAHVAGVSGDPKVFIDNRKSAEFASIHVFCVNEIDREVSINDFLNQKSIRVLAKPANLREMLSFIEDYPLEARRGRLVCINSGIISSVTDYPAMVVFEVRGSGFYAAIDYRSRTLLPGDVVIMKKK